MTDTEDRAIGRLEAQMANLAKTQEEMRGELRALTALLEQGKGARWMMGIVGAIAGGLASFIAAAFGLLQSH